MNESPVHNQSFPELDLVGVSASDLFLIMINLTFGFTILILKSGSERPGDFYKSVEIKCHDQ
jgi:hypothetical protein